MSKENNHPSLPEEKEIDREEEIFKKIQGCGALFMGFLTLLVVIILLIVRLYF